MFRYLAQRIIDGALQYDAVLTRYPNGKEEVDDYLTLKGHENLIQAE
ncbi:MULTISPECIES: hypothetical protein [unclassified Paenibacillus]|nr:MULTISPECIES: hypothetical protein [unclassified Paenibacillus]SLJ98089.1 hypothetical protein SAMN06272722_102694 [Paenibacillus sp. RU5A]SOC66821.1 hypothetical protein SAMN05880581_102303 [Paenibacillus sp. RU26A]SOC70030.1 hypothetical protein SAMN05880586_102694 [Paenibacillus sp. RU5M]